MMSHMTSKLSVNIVYFFANYTAIITQLSPCRTRL